MNKSREWITRNYSITQKRGYFKRADNSNKRITQRADNSNEWITHNSNDSHGHVTL